MKVVLILLLFLASTAVFSQTKATGHVSAEVVSYVSLDAKKSVSISEGKVNMFDLRLSTGMIFYDVSISKNNDIFVTHSRAMDDVKIYCPISEMEKLKFSDTTNYIITINYN